MIKRKKKGKQRTTKHYTENLRLSTTNPTKYRGVNSKGRACMFYPVLNI